MLCNIWTACTVLISWCSSSGCTVSITVCIVGFFEQRVAFTAECFIWYDRKNHLMLVQQQAWGPIHYYMDLQRGIGSNNNCISKAVRICQFSTFKAGISQFLKASNIQIIARAGRELLSLSWKLIIKTNYTLYLYSKLISRSMSWKSLKAIALFIYISKCVTFQSVLIPFLLYCSPCVSIICCPFPSSSSRSLPLCVIVCDCVSGDRYAGFRAEPQQPHFITIINLSTNTQLCHYHPARL